MKQSDIEKARVLLSSGKYSMGKVAKELQVSYTTLWRAVGKVAVG
ncbi:MAG: hypothetical protein OJF51_002720 [Nitrospira sp.]|nr:MAG: hypothetical protein OJF51_002720 [Nitrospira sp.]